MARLDLLTANDRPGEYPASWYAATGSPEGFASLEGEVAADVCVIGGGYAGQPAAAAEKEAILVSVARNATFLRSALYRMRLSW